MYLQQTVQCLLQQLKQITINIFLPLKLISNILTTCTSISSCGLGVRVMVFNATFNNISVILWPSVLLVEETGVPRENH
jgi:hypothetical protein